MAEHASVLILDSLAAGSPVDPAAASHVAGCPQCTRAVASRQAFSRALLESPEARRRLGLLQSKVIVEARRPARSWWVAALAMAVPLALVAVAVTRFIDSGPSERVKGSARLALVHDGGSVTQVPVGAQVFLELSAPGAAYGAVLSIDDASGGVDIVWPPNGDVSGHLSGKASERLAEFQVTEGSMVLHAFLSDRPLALVGLVRALSDGGVGNLSMHLDVTQ